MTSRSRNWPKYEIDISKGRDEGNWRKIIELGEVMKSKSPSSGEFKTLIIIYLCHNLLILC